MRAQFVLSEMKTGLRRNFTMTIAVVITVTISLVLLGAAWWTQQQINTMKGFWYGKIEVSVFLTNDVTQAQRDAIHNQLVSLPGVQRVYYESKAQAYQHFKHDFKDSPTLVANTSPDALPESFRVKLKDPRRFQVVASAMEGQPGVDQVVDQSRVLKKFFSLMHTLQVVAGIAAGSLILATLLLIYNAVRVAAFSRRRETGIMRLVGASNFYIRLPFVLEGSLIGLLGGLLSAAILAIVMGVLINGVLKPALSFTTFISWSTFWTTVPWLVVAGVVLTSVASFLTLQRHLRV